MASDAVYGLIGAVAGSALTIFGQAVQSIKETQREQDLARRACLGRLKKIKTAVSNSGSSPATTPPLTPIDYEKTANDEVYFLGGDIDRLLAALAAGTSRRWLFHRRSRKTRNDLATLDGLQTILVTHNLDEIDQLQADLERAIGLSGHDSRD